MTRTFANLMMKGKVHAALDLLSNNGRGGVLGLDHIVKSVGLENMSEKGTLMNKNQPAFADSILHGTQQRYIQLHLTKFMLS